MNYDTIALTESELSSEAIQQIKNIFDTQLIPLLIQSSHLGIEFHNCQKNFQGSGHNIKFSLNLEATHLTTQQVDSIQKDISDQKKDLN